uniref:Uncharacterized protein n=1 Tax=Arundo donax TaxID=35708 RepID=A0A0A9EVA3_ARUDO
MSRAYKLRRQWIATQNSPFSLVLTLSGNPGKKAKRSTVPAFSPFNQYLLNLPRDPSQKTKNEPSLLMDTPLGNWRLRCRTVVSFV